MTEQMLTAQRTALSPISQEGSMQEETKPMCDDREWAKVYCAFKRLRYLSHERYGDTLRIAVEAPGERYEVSVRVPASASATADKASDVSEPVNSEGQ